MNDKDHIKSKPEIKKSTNKKVPKQLSINFPQPKEKYDPNQYYIPYPEFLSDKNSANGI